MEQSKALAAFLIAGFTVAGAGGVYLATRGNDLPPETTAGQPASVEQSEGIVTPDAMPDRSAAVPGRRTAGRVAAAATPRPRAVQSAPRSRREAPAPLEPLAAAPAAEPTRPEPPPLVRVAETPAAIVPESIELEIAADSVLGLSIDSSISSEQARVEDAVSAHVTRDLRVGDRVAIPAGSRAEGEVTLVERGGRVKERARLGVRFTSVVLADGTRVPIDTETIYREGDAPSGESAAKIGGGAIGGAIIGGILGGAKGAIVGGSVGAGAGTAAVMAGGRNPATLGSGTPVTVRITQPASVTVEP